MLKLEAQNASIIGDLNCDPGDAFASPSCQKVYGTDERVAIVTALYRQYFQETGWESLGDNEIHSDNVLWNMSYRNDEFGASIRILDPRRFGDAAPVGATIIVEAGIFER